MKKRNVTDKNRKNKLIFILVVGIMIALGIVTLRLYQSRHTSRYRMISLQIAADKAQDAFRSVVPDHTTQESGQPRKDLDKSCIVSGYGYPDLNKHKLVCGISNTNSEGQYMPINQLTTDQLKQLFEQTDSVFKKLGYTNQLTQNPSGQVTLLSGDGHGCHISLQYREPLPELYGNNVPSFARTTYNLVHSIECSQVVIENQPGSYQISCKDKYLASVPKGYRCD